MDGGKSFPEFIQNFTSISFVRGRHKVHQHRLNRDVVFRQKLTVEEHSGEGIDSEGISIGWVER